MNTDKLEIQRLVKVCEANGILHAVICPGSRNTPLTIALNRSSIQCTVVADERVAGFFGMGMTLQTNQPTLLVCTSGSASLNFAPAIVEAFYQKIPLIIFTADRPLDMVDKGHGQTIRQSNIFANYIEKSFDYSFEFNSEKDFELGDKLIQEAISIAAEKSGPVHVNIPLQEPLYQLTNEKVAIQFENKVLERKKTDFTDLLDEYKQSKKVMLIIGQQHSVRLDETITRLSLQKNVVILSEVTSNVEAQYIFPCIDRVLSSLSEKEKADFAPDLLISIGGAVVSKKVKAFLAAFQAENHWSIGMEGWDTYGIGVQDIECEGADFVDALIQQEFITDSNTAYFQLWQDRDHLLKVVTKDYLDQMNWNDFKVFECLFNHIPKGSDVHYGNSTVVRYANLFDLGTKYRNYCNRGTSGIDGVTSTAMGSAYASKKQTTVISGDIAFLYDSNALWHQYINEIDLKIILINNGGGGIFRIIPGPDELNELETYFDCYSAVDIQKLVEAFGIEYHCCSDQRSLESELDQLYKYKGIGFLEIKTDGVESAQILRNYFKRLANFKVEKLIKENI